MERPIGKTIREARIARGLNRKVLADLAGVATRTLSSVESGQAGMGLSVDTLVRLADALELRLPGGVRKSYYGKSQADVRRKLKKAQEDAQNGVIVPAPIVIFRYSIHELQLSILSCNLLQCNINLKQICCVSIFN
jgi:transcriptional regulator with XRE-family HTH domain